MSTQPVSFKRRLGAVTVIAALAVGSVLLVPMLAGAQETTTTTPVDAERPDPEARIRAALDNLVTDGTISAAQADAVAADLVGDLGQDRRQFLRLHFGLDLVAGAIGIGEGELLEQLRSGQTIAEVAEANGVDPDTVVDAIVEGINSRVDAAVAAGTLDAEKAAQIKANAAERAAAIVNREWPGRPAPADAPSA